MFPERNNVFRIGPLIAHRPNPIYAAMIPLRAIPTLAVSLAALAFVAWATVLTPHSNGLYADRSPVVAVAAAHS